MGLYHIDEFVEFEYIGIKVGMNGMLRLCVVVVIVLSAEIIALLGLCGCTVTRSSAEIIDVLGVCALIVTVLRNV